MRKDRFLIGILVGIALLVVLAVSLFLMRRSELRYGPEDNPTGVVRNYITALQKQDYARAYGYLADWSKKPSASQFTQPFNNYQSREVAATGVEISEPTITEGKASLAISILRSSGGPFGDVYREGGVATLEQQDGAWKITSMPYPFWAYEWESDQYKNP